jgi:sulfur-oxidizing protein SoxZ
MSSQIKIRAQITGDTADIRVLMAHPMETGQRKDENGQLVPIQFIQSFTVQLNGKPLVDGQLNTSISKNPLFTFKSRGLKVGDKLSVAWHDNLGVRRLDEITVA